MAPSVLVLALLLSGGTVIASGQPADDTLAYKPEANFKVKDPLPKHPPPHAAPLNTTGCQTIQQVFAAFNLTTLATAANKAGVDDLLYKPGNTVFVPLESAVYRLSASGQTTALTASALGRGNSKKYLDDITDFVKMAIVPGAVSTLDMHDAERLDTALHGKSLEVKLPSPFDHSNVLILGPYARMHALVVRRDISVCGGGYVHVIDAVLLPHPM